MKINYLFPHRYKKIGWIILIPSLILGLYILITDYTPAFFDAHVFAISADEIFGEKKIFGMIDDNILNEIMGVLIIIGSLLVAFSKELNEDEYISKIRLESLVWATYFNYSLLLFSLIFFYGFTFLWVMVFNMFTILIFFIFRFNWEIRKLKKLQSDEE